MSRNKTRAAKPPEELPQQAPSSLLLVPAIVWLISFFTLFQLYVLPNNSQFSRLDIWRELPILLLDLLIPVYDENSPPSGWQFLSQRFDLITIAIIVQFSAWAYGHLILRVIRLQSSLSRLEQIVFGHGLGLAAISLLTLGCGLLGLLNQTLFAGLHLVAILIACILLWRDRQRPPEPATSDQRTAYVIEPFPLACLLAMLPFFSLILLGSLLPSTDFDVREYHLQGPKEFFQNGRITMLSHNVYTSFPFLTEMLSLNAMVLRGDWMRGALAGKGVLMGFAPLTALALFAAGSRWFSRTVGWLAALIFIATPWTYRISIIAYAEGGLTCYLFLTTFAALICLDRNQDSNHSFLRMVFLTGLLAGSAMSCKYPGALMVIIPVGVLLMTMPWFTWQQYSEQEHSSKVATANSAGVWQKCCRITTVYALGCAIAVGPWLLKNTSETGNPVYPLLYSVFGSSDWDADMDAKWKRAHSPDHHLLSDLGVKLIDVTTKSDWQSVLIYAFAPLVFLCGFKGKKRYISMLLWSYALFLFLAWWVFTHRIDRFWVPMIPVTALLAGIGVTWTTHRLWHYLSTVVLVAALIYQLGFISTALCGPNWYLMDLAAAQQQAEKITNPNLIELNVELPENARVLSVGEAAVFNAQFDVLYNTVFDNSLFELWCASPETNKSKNEWLMKPSDAILQRFHEEGVTHIMVNWQEILRYRLTYGYTDFVTPERFSELVKSGVLTPAPFGKGFRSLESLSDQERTEIERWGPQLIKEIQSGTTSSERYVSTFEVFTVTP